MGSTRAYYIPGKVCIIQPSASQMRKAIICMLDILLADQEALLAPVTFDAAMHIHICHNSAVLTAVPGLLATASTDKRAKFVLLHFALFHTISFHLISCISSHLISFHSYLTVLVVEPVVTHQTSWLESTGVPVLPLSVVSE